MVGKQKAEQGFTVGTVLLVAVLIAAGFFGYRYVSRSNQDNKKQADILQAALDGDEQDASDRSDSAEIDSGPTAEEQEAKVIAIRSVDVKVTADNTILTATLPGTYTGTCYADVELPDGSHHEHYVEPFDNSKTCNIYILRSNLVAGKTWSYAVGYYTSPSKYKGTYPKGTFSQ